MVMSKTVSEIVKDLKQTYKMDSGYYPKISMETDLEKGFEGEVKNVISQLRSNCFDVSSENVFLVMEFKKMLLEKYYGIKGKKTTEEYRRLIVEDLRSVGSPASIEFLLVSGIVLLILYMGGRFLGSFADEMGKIAPQKLLNDDEKKNSAKLNIDVKEYRIIAREVNLVMQDTALTKTLEELTKSEKQKKSQLKQQNKKKNVNA
jgi:hypothetical protein